ncbi:MAG: EamA family transporter [Desulfitobacteriaceae bacterium]
MGYLYITLAILCTVYGQIAIKWQLLRFGQLPSTLYSKLIYFGHVFSNIWVISGLMASVLATISWMAAMTKFQLSYAYPFMSVAFILVLIFSALLLKEPVTLARIIGLVFIVCGIIINSRG